MDHALEISCPVCHQPLKIRVVYDPGVHTFSNGDPGYPPTLEFWPEDESHAQCDIFSKVELEEAFNTRCEQAWEKRPEPQPPDFGEEV